MNDNNVMCVSQNEKDITTNEVWAKKNGMSRLCAGLGTEFAVGQTLRLRFVTSPRPSISAAIDGSGTGFIQLPFSAIVPGDCRPCLLLRDPGINLKSSLDLAPQGPDELANIC